MKSMKAKPPTSGAMMKLGRNVARAEAETGGMKKGGVVMKGKGAATKGFKARGPMF